MATIQLAVVTPEFQGGVAPPSRLDRTLDEALNVLVWEAVIALAIAHRRGAVRARRARDLARPALLPPPRRRPAARGVAGQQTRAAWYRTVPAKDHDCAPI